MESIRKKKEEKRGLAERTRLELWEKERKKEIKKLGQREKRRKPNSTNKEEKGVKVEKREK